jgi:hypothetical protein
VKPRIGKWPQSNLRPFFLFANGTLAVFQLAAAWCCNEPAKTRRDKRALVAALFPVMMDLHLVAYRMVMIIGVRRADNANGDSGERECKQDFLHGFSSVGLTWLMDGPPY